MVEERAERAERDSNKSKKKAENLPKFVPRRLQIIE